MTTKTAASTDYSSEWGALSPHLVASFYELKKTGHLQFSRIASGEVVKAPLTEVSMEIALNWQSPFESAGPETKAPALMAMLQSGAFQPFMAALKIGDGKELEGEELVKQSNEFLRQFEGKSGITKLNSTQVFNGMPPVKISATLLFRAWKDPIREVEQPFWQLMQWAMPEEISADNTTLIGAIELVRGKKASLQEAFLPSKNPSLIGMTYKGRTYSPLVVESVQVPLASSVDKNGNYVELLLPVTLCSLTAWDRKDFDKIWVTA